MNVGTIGYEVHSGLGHLVRDYYQHGIVTRLLPIRHSHYKNYPGKWIAPCDRYINPHEFIRDLDVLLLFETGFNWGAIRRAKDRGVKVVVIPIYEYTPFPLPVKPDLILCGSLLDVDYYKEQYPTKFLNVPVDTERFPWCERTVANVFIHNAGHGQRGFAKGTPQILDAMEYVQSDVKVIVRGQPGERRIRELFSAHHDPRVELRLDEFSEQDLYSEGDVFINAEQFNGLSLPLQEAYASGMPVVTTDRYPANTWLPKSILLPVDHVVQDREAVQFTRSMVTPQAIAAQIDALYGRDISRYSQTGKEWAENHSWRVVGPQIIEVLECLL